MCTLPHHAGCARDASDGINRRAMLRTLTAIGLTAPLATLILNRAAMAGSISFLDRGELIDGMTALIARAKSAELQDVRVFELSGSDLPWKDLGITLAKGQEATFLLGGRVWLSREQDLWVEPGVAFHVRTRGTRPIFNPMSNTGTMTAAGDGPLEMARSLVEFQDEQGELAVPKNEYAKADARIYGLALVWRGSALAGLDSLLSHGDVDGIIGAEKARLQSPRKLPSGWNNFFMLGGGPVIFNDIGNGAISCEPLKNAGILQHPVSIELKPQTTLSWRWIVEELPSRLPEDQLTSHDYLSIAAEFDDGQDLTYSGARASLSARRSVARSPAGRRSNRTWWSAAVLPISASGSATNATSIRTTSSTSAARPNPSCASGCSAFPSSSAAPARAASPTCRSPSRVPRP
jgi:hypothetical protein